MRHTAALRRGIPASDRLFLALLGIVGTLAAFRDPQLRESAPPAPAPQGSAGADSRLGHDEPAPGAAGSAAPGSRGRDATAPSEIPARGWWDIAKRTAKEASKDRLVAVAAGVTFYSLLALFPAVGALVSLYGLFADPASISQHLQAMSGLLPGGAIDILGEQIHRITSQPGGRLGLSFAIGLLVSLWSANAGMKAVFDALNVVYDEEEKRSFVKLNAISLVFTLGAILLVLAAAAAVVVVPLILAFVGLGPLADTLIRLARWPVLLVLIALALAVLYRYGPSRETAKWRWITWGSAFAAIGWVVASVLFSWYAANFGKYNATYGSLGAVIGFMTWIWISAIVVLLGAELNSEIEHQTEVDSTTGRPRPLGTRGAEMADSVGAPQS